MKHVKFTNNNFYYLLLTYLGILLIYNMYKMYTLNSIYNYNAVSFIIQATILILVLLKSRYARIVILVWSVIFILAVAAIQLLGSSLLGVADDFGSFKIFYFFSYLINVFLGVAIANYTLKTVIVYSDDKS